MQPYELELVGQLLIAFVFGVIIGFDRERSNKPAGIRTQMLICVGSTLLTGISIHLAEKLGYAGMADPARLMAQIVAGIGFVGAGVILKTEHRVTGVTTAATLWATAAMGIAIGSGFYIPAVVTALMILAIEPLGVLQYKFGLKAYSYTLKVHSDSWDETLKLLKHLEMKFRITHLKALTRQIIVSSSEEKRKDLEEALVKKDILFDIYDSEE
jgi:uncharacterized membrane protein YhiD involved in acid resistance